MVNNDEACWRVGGGATDPGLNMGDLTRSVGHRNGKDLISPVCGVGFA
jgi:hypothetical protein